MSRNSLILIGSSLILLISAPVQAQNLINNFTAQSQGENQVRLDWRSGDETGLASFRVERSLDGLDYTTLSIIQPQGSNFAYAYTDNDIYKSSNRTYYYRIRAQMNDNSFSFSPVQTVTLFFSGIQQTWGSIKALFR